MSAMPRKRVARWISYRPKLVSAIAALCLLGSAHADDGQGELTVFRNWCDANLPGTKTHANPKLCRFQSDTGRGLVSIGNVSLLGVRALDDELLNRPADQRAVVNGKVASCEVSNSLGTQLIWHCAGKWRLTLIYKNGDLADDDLVYRTLQLAESLDNAMVNASPDDLAPPPAEPEEKKGTSLVIVVDRSDCMTRDGKFRQAMEKVAEYARWLQKMNVAHREITSGAREAGLQDTDILAQAFGPAELALMTYGGPEGQADVRLEKGFRSDCSDIALKADELAALDDLVGGPRRPITLGGDETGDDAAPRRDLPWAIAQAAIHAHLHASNRVTRVAVITCSQDSPDFLNSQGLRRVNRMLTQVGARQGRAPHRAGPGSLWTIPWAAMAQPGDGSVIIGGPGETLEDALARLEGLFTGAARIPAINVVPVGPPPDAETAAVLRELCEGSGGRFTPVASAADIGAALDQTLPDPRRGASDMALFPDIKGVKDAQPTAKPGGESVPEPRGAQSETPGDTAVETVGGPGMGAVGRPGTDGGRDTGGADFVVGGAPDVGDMVICREVVNGHPLGLANHFPSASKLYGHLTLREPLADGKVAFAWERNGHVVYGDQLLTPANAQTVTMNLDMGGAGGFREATYELEVTSGGRVIGRKTFTVGTADVASRPVTGGATAPVAGDASDEAPVDSDPEIYFGPVLPDGVDPFAETPTAPAGRHAQPGVRRTGRLDTAGLTAVITDTLDGSTAPPAKTSFPADTVMVHLYLRTEATPTGGALLLTWYRGEEIIERQAVQMAGHETHVMSLFSSDENALRPGDWRLVIQTGQETLGTVAFTIGR